MQISMITTSYLFPFLLTDLIINPCMFFTYFFRFVHKVVIFFTDVFPQNSLHNFSFLLSEPQFPDFKCDEYAYFREYSWPLNNARVRAPTPCRQKSEYNFTAGPLYPQFHIQGFNKPWIGSTVVCIYWKKSACKWTCTVQIHVVQGATVVTGLNDIMHIRCLSTLFNSQAVVNSYQFPSPTLISV